jgi:hypothetical protein
VLHDILPATGKFYEGVDGGFEIKSLNPKHAEAKQKLVAIARDYASRERSDQYNSPVEVSGEVSPRF